MSKLYTEEEVKNLIKSERSPLIDQINKFKKIEADFKVQSEALADANINAAEMVVEIEDQNIKLNELNEEVNNKSDQLAEAYDRLENSFDDLKKDQALKEIELKRMEVELITAKTVQDMLINHEPPKNIPDISIAASYNAASESGGDWIGFLVDTEKPSIHVLIGDVTGHGIGSALLTAGVYSYFTSLDQFFIAVREMIINELLQSKIDLDFFIDIINKTYRKILNPEQMLKILNNVIKDMGKGSMYMTFFASSINYDEKTITWSNAGHCHPFFLRRKEDGTWLHLQSDVFIGGYRLGQEEISTQNNEYTSKNFKLYKDDLILWYTDGLIENKNDKGESLSKKQVRTWLVENAHKSVDEIKIMLEQKYKELLKNTNLQDDVAFILLKVG